MALSRREGPVEARADIDSLEFRWVFGECRDIIGTPGARSRFRGETHSRGAHCSPGAHVSRRFRAWFR
jgi:hypothetical protein